MRLLTRAAIESFAHDQRQVPLASEMLPTHWNSATTIALPERENMNRPVSWS